MSLDFLRFTLTGSWLAAWFWFLVLTILVWLKRHIDVNRGAREATLTDVAPDGPEPLPSLTVLVAAKDEELNIETCLRGLLRQDYPALQVVAINDRSADRTAALAERVAAADPRVHVEHVTQLPDGWAGKNHAMHCGVAHARGELLCFTDADCRFHAPHLLRAAVRCLQRDGVEFLSVLPELDAHSTWERIIQPAAGGIMVYWFSPQSVNSPKRRAAYANGAFMLMSRGTYERIGGHAAIAAQLNEDMRFARRAKDRGVRLRVIRGAGMYTVRMYETLPQIWNGWTRIFHGSFETWTRLVLSAFFLVAFSVLPLVSLVLSPLAGSAGPGIALAAGAACIAQQSVLWRFYRLSAMPRLWALTYPLGAAMCFAILVNAMARLAGRRTTWRGTLYRHPA